MASPHPLNSPYKLKKSRHPKESSKRETSPELTRPWPAKFAADGRPLPSDNCVDGVITIFDAEGKIAQFIDPSTRVVIDATSYEKLGIRLDRFSQLEDGEAQPHKQRMPKLVHTV